MFPNQLKPSIRQWGKEHLQQIKIKTKTCLQHWLHISIILVTFYMNKIYYVLYIVKTLYHLLHVALSKKRVFYCISRSNHGPAAWQPSRRRRHAGELFSLTISFGMRTHQGSFGNRRSHVHGWHLLTSWRIIVEVEKHKKNKKALCTADLPLSVFAKFVLFLDQAKARVAAATKSTSTMPSC